MIDFKEVKTTEHEPGRAQRVATIKATQIMWMLLGFFEALIALRIVFKLIGVNASNAFASLIYNITELFVAPFASLTGAPSAGGMVLEISSIIAMIIYLLIGWALERIVYVAFYRQRGPVTRRQTVVSDHILAQAPRGMSTSQTTDTEELTNPQTPGSV